MATPNRDITDAIVRLSEGNPGAVNVLCQLVESCKNEMTAELICHALEIMPLTGGRIWDQYKDIHGQDIGKFGRSILTWVDHLPVTKSKEVVDAYQSVARDAK